MKQLASGHGAPTQRIALRGPPHDRGLWSQYTCKAFVERTTSGDRDVPCLQCGYSLRGLPRSTFFWLSAVTIGWTFGALVISAPRGLHKPSESRKQVAKAEVLTIAQQVRMYLLDNRLAAVPNGFTLDALTQPATMYLKPCDLIDPWGNPIFSRDRCSESESVPRGQHGIRRCRRRKKGRCRHPQ